MNKFFGFYFFAAILTIAMLSCSGSGSAQSKPRTKKEVEAKLKNFSISLVAGSDSQEPRYLKQVGNDKGSFFEMKCDRMESFDDDFNEFFIKYHKIDFVDFTANKAYGLDVPTKTGEFSEFGAAEATRYKGIDRVIGQFLFIHDGKNDLKKTGNEKIIGRNATVYTIKYYGEEHQKFWIDDEYGFTLKFEQFNPVMKMYVTEFIVGGASVEGLVNLGEYKLVQDSEDADDTPEPEIVEGVLSIAAMKKAAADAGFTVWGGWFTLTNWTTHSNSKQKPNDGFQISVRRDGSNFMGIAVLEFASEEIAKEYVAFAATEEAYFGGNIYRSGVFTAVISGSLVEDHEAKLMEALKEAGWK